MRNRVHRCDPSRFVRRRIGVRVGAEVVPTLGGDHPVGDQGERTEAGLGRSDVLVERGEEERGQHGGRGDDQCQRGRQPLGAPQVEGGQRHRAGPVPLAHQHRGDDEAGDGEETSTPTKPPVTGRPAWKAMTTSTATARSPWMSALIPVRTRASLGVVSTVGDRFHLTGATPASPATELPTRAQRLSTVERLMSSKPSFTAR